MEIKPAVAWSRPGGEAEDKARAIVAEMLADIDKRGEEAVNEYSTRFDGRPPRLIPLQPWESYDLSDHLRGHIQIAAQRIEAFAKLQFSMYRDLERGDKHGRFGQKVVPLDSMVAYIPGGRFPLVSTAMMTLIPARVAGVAERVAVSPSDHPGVLAAASLAGATKFIQMGGAQAVAAVVNGFSLQDPVDMVVGPGNAFVNAAKALLQDRVKIDTLAGPSEILVLCDDSIDPAWVALDVLAQAEHDPMALSVLGSTSETVLQRVAEIIEAEAKARPDKDTGIIQLLKADNTDQLIDLANRMGAEHLHVAVQPGSLDLDQIRHYGSLFIGPYSAVALGDYCTGPNHTLPTVAAARQKGGLNVGDFLKILTWQEVDGAGFSELAQTGIALAEVEELEYHQKSLEVRLPKGTE